MQCIQCWSVEEYQDEGISISLLSQRKYMHFCLGLQGQTSSVKPVFFFTHFSWKNYILIDQSFSLLGTLTRTMSSESYLMVLNLCIHSWTIGHILLLCSLGLAIFCSGVYISVCGWYIILMSLYNHSYVRWIITFTSKCMINVKFHFVTCLGLWKLLVYIWPCWCM